MHNNITATIFSTYGRFRLHGVDITKLDKIRIEKEEQKLHFITKISLWRVNKRLSHKLFVVLDIILIVFKWQKYDHGDS